MQGWPWRVKRTGENVSAHMCTAQPTEIITHYFTFFEIRPNTVPARDRYCPVLDDKTRGENGAFRVIWGG
jgi:hypothetical protein